MELSEAIYLNEFEMLSKREDAENNIATSNARFSRADSEVSRTAINESTENLRKNFYNSFDRQLSSSKKRSTVDMSTKTNDDNTNYMNITNSVSKSPAKAEAIRGSKSQSNLASPSVKPPSSACKATQLNESSSPSTNSIMATTPAAAANVVSSKLGNVRLDKHVSPSSTQTQTYHSESFLNSLIFSSDNRHVQIQGLHLQTRNAFGR